MAQRTNIRQNREASRMRLQNLIRLASEIAGELDALQLSGIPVEFLPINEGIDFFEEVRGFEILLIKQAMKCTGGSQVKAADLLSLNPTTLNSKIKAYKIGYGRS
jgi:DNA-binding NtrC family response regulator